MYRYLIKILETYKTSLDSREDRRQQARKIILYN